MNGLSLFNDALKAHLDTIQALHAQLPMLETIAERMSRAVFDGHKILWCGNGGSAADSQHLAAEFVGRFLKERNAWPSIALTARRASSASSGTPAGTDPPK